MRLCQIVSHDATQAQWEEMRSTFLVAVSHPDELLRARDLANAEGSTLILDNLSPPPNPVFGSVLGTLNERLQDLKPTPELIEREVVDASSVNVTYWCEVESDEERNIVAALAFWSACWSIRAPMPRDLWSDWAEDVAGQKD